MTLDTCHPQAADPSEPTSAPGAPRRYHVIAVQVPIVFNFDGDHDPNGMIYALAQHKDALDDIRENFEHNAHTPDPLVRPLVLRARRYETVEVHFTNHIEARSVGIHLVGDGYDVQTSDGAAVGNNPSSLVAPGSSRTYRWECNHEGVFPFHDMGNLSGGEEGTNVHGLFGALVVEPEGATWTDPETSHPLEDGLYADVHPKPPGPPTAPYDQAPPNIPMRARHSASM